MERGGERFDLSKEFQKKIKKISGDLIDIQQKIGMFTMTYGIVPTHIIMNRKKYNYLKGSSEIMGMKVITADIEKFEICFMEVTK